jgi:flagellar biosynthesis protein FliR
MFRYEHRSQQPISKAAFLRRLGRSFLVGFLLISLSLGLGMFGYCYFEGLSLTDSFLNASMILGGMGPVDPMKTEAGKIFAGAYALYSGLAFLVLAGLLFGPIAHRILHRFHYGVRPREED